MAISASAKWNILSTATGTAGKNGGFFVTGASGTDYSLQNGAQFALTTATSAGAGDTLLSASAATTMVGNGAFTVSGTNLTLNSWFEVVSVVAGVSITFSTNKAGTSIATGVVANGTVNIGGANHLNSTLADDMFEAGTAGNIYYIKNGTYTTGEAINIGNGDSSTTAAYQFLGYNSTQGDTPTWAQFPLINSGANAFTMGLGWIVKNISLNGTPATLFTAGSVSRVENCKFVNNSSTTTRVALNAATFWIIGCEASSYRGYALSTGANSTWTNGCFIHSSDVGHRSTNAGTGASMMLNNIYESNVTAAIHFTAGQSGVANILSCTLYGAENKLGLGINAATGFNRAVVKNSIIYGYTTGITVADTQMANYDDYNDFYNNTTDVSSTAVWQKGPSDIALNPTFTNVSQVTGTQGAFVAGNNKLVDTNKNFTTLGVVAGDTVLITAGTGFSSPAYPYLIDSISTTTNANDTLNITLPAGPGTDTTADKVYQITIGHNYAVGTNMKAAGYPGAFPGRFSTGYLDIGAVERQEPTGGSGGFFIQ